MTNLTLSDYRTISSGTHNMGEVRINGEGKLEKINNRVWCTSENNIMTTAQENMRVREDLFRLLSADVRMSNKLMLETIKAELLGENSVRALKRDEIAAYIGALDRGSVKGLKERVIQLRNRTGQEKTGEIRLLTSERASAAVRSVNEQLGEARVRFQCACKTLMLFSFGAEPNLEGFKTRLADEFCKAMGFLFAAYKKEFVMSAETVKDVLTQALATPVPPGHSKASTTRAHWLSGEVAKALTEFAERSAGAAGFPASRREELLQHVKGNLTNFPYRCEKLTLAPSVAEELLPRAVELGSTSSRQLLEMSGRVVDRPLGVDCKGVALAEAVKKIIQVQVAGECAKEDDGSLLYEDFNRGYALTVGENDDDGLYDVTKVGKDVKSQAEERLDKIKNFFIDPGNPDAPLDEAARQKVETLKHVMRSLANQKFAGIMYDVLSSFSFPFGNALFPADEGRVDSFNLRKLNDRSFVLHCSETGRIATILGSKDSNETFVLAPDAGEQTKIGFHVDIRIDFDENGQPTISVGESTYDLKVPENLKKGEGEDVQYHVDPDAPANEAPAVEVPEEPQPEDALTRYQGAEQKIASLSNEFPIGDADRMRFLAEAADVKKIIAAVLPSMQGDDKVTAEAQLAVIEARMKQVEDLRLSKPTSYRNVLKTVRQWCKAAEACYEFELESCRLRSRPEDVAKLQPKESLKAELYLGLMDFDDITDLDAECPNVERYLKNIQSQLAKKLVKALKPHGVKRDAGLMSEMIGYCMGLLLNQGPWATVSKDLQLTVGGKNVSAKSVLTPAKRINGFSNIEGFEYEEGVNGYNSASFETEHAVNLLSSEYSVDGETVFRGMRHGVNCAIGIQDPEQRKRANVHRAREIVAAAILSNPELIKKMPQDPNGVRTFFMTSTSLLTPDWIRPKIKDLVENERMMLNEQIEAWRALEGETLEFDVPDPDNPQGAPIRMKFKVDVASFNFGVNAGGVGTWSNVVGGWDVSDPINRQGWEKLSRRVASMVDDLPEAKRNVILTLQRQVDDILRQQGERKDNHDAYKVVARINALSTLLDGVPAWNCKSGKDRTGELDVETKFLLTLIAKGRPIPEPGAQLSDEQRKIFQTIALQGGNHEIQEYNTGIGGFKTKGVDSIVERLGGEQAYEVHSGGSKWVHT